MKIAIVVSRASAIDTTWTTSHLACSLLAHGHKVRVIEPWDFEVVPGGQAIARAHAFDEPSLSRERFCTMLAHRSARRCYEQVSQFDAMLLRLNPLDLGALSFALIAQQSGVCVLNEPSSLLRISHKAFLATLSDVPRPDTLVTRSRAAVRSFADRHPHGVVVKPARASGGRGVQWVHHNHLTHLDVAIDEVRSHGDGYLVVQEYLPDARNGEKRILWVGGQLIGAYLRQRAPGEFRHNLKQGGRPEPTEISAEERDLVAAVSPHLHEQGVWIAGLDVIGNRLVEINTLNPGGFHLIEQHSDQDLGSRLVDSLVERIRVHQPEAAIAIHTDHAS